MKTAFIRHYESIEDFERYCTKKDLMESHLVSYSFEGDYIHIVKSRFSQSNIITTIPNYLELVKYTLQNKPYNFFNKPTKTVDFNETVRNIWYRRLEKLEVDLFPAGYVDCPGLQIFTSVPVPERLSRIEKKLGVVQSPGDDLGRLENCEGMLKITYWRLNTLDREIYPTQKDVDGMSATTTLDGWMEKLERKLGVNLAFTDIDHRLKHIEDAWACTKMAIKTPYVCPILKHQQALQDALQEKFGEKKTYVPKYHIGDILVFNYESGYVNRKIVAIRLEILNVPFYRFDDGVTMHCETIDNDTLSIFKVTPQGTPLRYGL